MSDHGPYSDFSLGGTRKPMQWGSWERGRREILRQRTLTSRHVTRYLAERTAAPGPATTAPEALGGAGGIHVQEPL